MGRGHDAHVDLHRRRPADALEPPLLEHAEELHLQGRRQLAHLVEEERAAVRQLEPAHAPPVGAR